MFEFGWTPSQWLSFTVEEKALIIAGFQRHDEEQKREEQRAKSKVKHH
ncbi:hypothetical protein JC2156_04270 [Weissella koreensis KCTC 3621]|nr:hypothetical protein [Weissella koreensis]EJF33717.1 hypothetical protein JC2156_05310 [Weissella koreensis KCTC 3621]EJF34119.1 hypothetical protein JC2156_04270 [Weissella koreensis KCTC 3621]